MKVEAADFHRFCSQPLPPLRSSARLLQKKPQTLPQWPVELADVVTKQRLEIGERAAKDLRERFPVVDVRRALGFF